jgi:putative heme iron utilization protein
MVQQGNDTAAATARRLMRALDRATLATSLEGWPYASLVLVALDHDASPLLLLSDLAEHSKNIKRDPRLSLLFDGTAGRDDPLTGPRVSVLGEAQLDADPRRLARFTARHPAAAGYAGFADFKLYRVAVARAHLVAGFGRIDWIAADALRQSGADPALAAAESDILAHMNADHADTLDLYATRLAGQSGTGWRLTGIDPEGADLRRAGGVARLDFGRPVRNAQEVRRAFIELAQRAREEGKEGQ